MYVAKLWNVGHRGINGACAAGTRQTVWQLPRACFPRIGGKSQPPARCPAYRPAGAGERGSPALGIALALAQDAKRRAFTLPLGLPLVPALEEGASKCAAKQVEHQQGGRRFLVNLDPLGVEREDGEDVAMPPMALGRPGADVAGHPGVVFELKGAWREP